MKHIYLFTLLLFFATNIKAQSAGTYDASFSGDGKETYTGNTISDPQVFFYNNQYITFINHLHDISGNSPIADIAIIKHDINGIFLSYKVILSDSALSLANQKHYYMRSVKQTSNGKFILSTADQASENAVNSSTLGATPYKSILRRIDASGAIDPTFGTAGKVTLVTDTIYNPNIENSKDIVISLYSDNSIFAAHQFYNTSYNVKTKVYKVSSAGVVVTGPITIGTGNYDYYIKDAYVNTDNSVYLSGVTNYSTTSTHHTNYVVKLNSGLGTYDNSFNTNGRLFIDRGQSMWLSGGSAPDFPSEMRITANGTDLFTFFLTEDTVNPGNNLVYIQQYSPAGAFVAEKNIAGSGYSIDNILDIKIDNAGKIVTLSTQYVTGSKAYIVRLNPTTLTYDNTFNSNGKKTLSFGTGNSNFASSFLIHSDDKLVIACQEVTSDYYLALARLNSGLASLITNIEKEQGVTLYPNPAKEFIKIAFDHQINDAIIEMYDLNGRLLKQNSLIENEMIDVSDIANGLYIISIKHQNGTIINSNKIMVQH